MESRSLHVSLGLAYWPLILCAFCASCASVWFIFRTKQVSPLLQNAPAILEVNDDSEDSFGGLIAASDLGFNLLLFVMLLLTKSAFSPAAKAVSVKLPEIDANPNAAAGAGTRSLVFEIAPDGRITINGKPDIYLSVTEAAALAGPGTPAEIAVDHAAPAGTLVELETALSKNGVNNISINALIKDKK